MTDTSVEAIGRLAEPVDFASGATLVRSATVNAVEPIHALVIRCDGFDRLMNDYPSVRLEILSALTQRIRNQAPADSD